MKRIGLISDSHGDIPERLFDFFAEVDEIWHAGDIGNAETSDKLNDFKPLRAVYGNIDGQDVRVLWPENQRFFCEGTDVWMTHIGGYPGNYDRKVKPEIFQNPPKLFICGHSHILKVIYDKKLDLLHINPGASGRSGFHKVQTAIRFVIDDTMIKDMDIWQVERK